MLKLQFHFLKQNNTRPDLFQNDNPFYSLLRLVMQESHSAISRMASPNSPHRQLKMGENPGFARKSSQARPPLISNAMKRYYWIVKSTSETEDELLLP
jgi:hypothetical protein